MAKTKTPCCIEWRLRAREDLRAIVAYIGKDNPNGARSFGQELRDRRAPLLTRPSYMMTARFLETLAVEFDEVA
ncbi:type II toxin-antitoxin system RelE/ParE family toxin [Nitrosovibrio sp. Nv4]|uniref:type II toxin-antitoxin system RelE/ParE family toxin n=1 Tax=Nitrosovibrio sp. Nv4 TaxID=1945880 RepID=UPI000BD1B1F7|nr:type II toxin-antitoxin system RelE/ParE family toxin [Nitrosovibrio sp. Nv4]SOD41818.1 hypothetical protein SAMN06298226_2124 [Nitrosovibrio sp. Nv4]